jgi:hypothetical protein
MVRPSGSLASVLVLAACVVSATAGAQVIPATACSVSGPPLIPQGMTVSKWGSRTEEEVDGWVPFQFQVPAGTQVSSVGFELTVQPIGQLISTDSFYCLGADDKGVMIYDNFESLPLGTQSVAKATIDCQSYPTIFEQIKRGTLRCCVQDDTALFSAQMVLDGSSSSSWQMPPVSGYTSPVEVIQVALGITASDPAEQNRRRATFIAKAIHSRVQNQNQDRKKADLVTDREDAKTMTVFDPWWIGAGYCRHHAALLIAMCKAAGVAGVKSLMSGVAVPGEAPGHEFPVVNLPPGADLDRPWTWGKDALVVDSWNGEILTPQQVWKHFHYFVAGSANCKVGDYGWSSLSEQKSAMTSREAYQYFESNPDKKSNPSYLKLVPADIRANPNAPGALRPPDSWNSCP